MSSSSPVSALSASTTTTTTTTAATATTTTTATTAVITPVTTPITGLEPMDVKESQVDPPIPVNTSAEITIDSNQNSLISSTISDNVYPISTPLEQGALQPRSCLEDMSPVQESLESLNLGTNHTNLNGELPPQNGPSDAYKSPEVAPMNSQGGSTEPATAGASVLGIPVMESVLLTSSQSQDTAPIQPESSAPIRLISRNSEHSSVVSDSADSSPVIVVSSQSQSPEPFADQLKPIVPMLIDEPDERLLNALETPRDRLFVIKLEKDVISFIQENICEVFDLPPINAYQRLLAHKMAEYYRLTHVADATGASVRFYRGQHARIFCSPPVRLGDKPNAALQQNSATNGSAPPMKIMQRTRCDSGSTAPEHRNSSTLRKPHSEASPGDTSARKFNREEREEAYKAARERIFKDFVISPPETPPPTKVNDKQMRQEQPDDFSGRSQFFPILSPPPPAVNPHYYPQYEDPGLQFQGNSHIPVTPRPNPNTPSFNPGFNHPNGNFTQQPYMPVALNRQAQTPNDRFNAQSPVNINHLGYPQQPPQHHHQHHQQSQQQPQQRNAFYDQSIHFNPSGHPQQHNPMINPSFTNPPRFIPQQSLHSTPHHPTPPIPASGNRHPYNSPSNYAVNNNNITQLRFPQQGFGWNPPPAGVPMNVTRSQPGMQSFDRSAPPFGGLPYQAHQQQPWGGGGTTFGRGYGNGGGGMHRPVGGM